MTAIKVQVVVETLFALVASQLAIVGQFGEEIYLWRIRLFFWERGILC